MGAVYGVSPYLNGPHGIAQDPLFQYVGAKWAYMPSVYGPVFTMLSYALAPLSIVASVLAYKLIAAVSALAIVAMVWNLARLRGLDPVRAVALVGLNPLLALYGIGGGHNDLLMLVPLVGAIYATVLGRERSAAACRPRRRDQAHRPPYLRLRARRRRPAARARGAGAIC